MLSSSECAYIQPAPHRGQSLSRFAVMNEDQSLMYRYAVTYAIALMLIFFAMCGFLPASSARSSSLANVSNDTDTQLGRAFQLLAWSGALILILGYWRRVLKLSLRMRPMLGLTLLAPLSALWSQQPAYSLRRGIFLVLGMLFAFYLVSRFPASELAQMTMLAGVVAGTLGILVSVFVPGIGIDSFNVGAWEGIFRSKNGCGQVMLFFMLPAMAFRFRSRFMACMRYALFVVAAVLIFMSNAKTAWILTPCMIAFLAAASWSRRLPRKDALLLLVAGVAMLTLIACLIPYVLPAILEALGKDPQISGRVPLWMSSLLAVAKRPLLGFGYQAFWTGMSGEALNVFTATHFEIGQAQNGFLEVALELGLVGVTLVLLTLLKATRDALVCLRYGHTPAVNWYVAILVLSVVYNLDEAFFASAHTLAWLFYVIACAGLAAEARQIRRIEAAAFHTAAAKGMPDQSKLSFRTAVQQ